MLLERAREILERVDHTEREVMRIGQGVAGRLQIAFVARRPMGCCRRSSGVSRRQSRYRARGDEQCRAESALIRREIDIAIAKPRVEDDELKSEILVKEPLILAVPDTFRERELRLADLEVETFILSPGGLSRVLPFSCWTSAG
ncbi:DNA-binding transcriptional LysR family regulator [Rhizobium sp. BK529]|uniref:LysR substrate-binding domain-containing protein n=1 Tax=Rhizobium sp. BK529 TaxID=2586983 RepID=UPI0017B89E3D|nr:LysR substrate-binding domain-containing protein [Rhizobium sp. BK529]MBB3595156.1 DNA-binding transcriptional LysR family regulator [Rhizobium sp. BK529]